MRRSAGCVTRGRRRLLFALVAALGGCLNSPGLAPDPVGFAGAPFSQADFSGQWRYAAIFHGPSVETGLTRGWERGSVLVGGDGQVTIVSMAASNGSLLSIAPSRIRAVDEDGFGAADYLGSGRMSATITDVKVNATHSLIAGVGSTGEWTEGRAAAFLLILERIASQSSFSSADLAGSTWAYHRLTTGASPSWEHGAAGVDADLVLSITERVWQAGAQPDPPLSGTVAIDAYGGVTLASDATWLGVLSADKNLVVATRTLGGGRFALEVYVRRGQTFTLADLAGRSASHAILAAPGGTWAWAREVFTTDGAGYMTLLSALTTGQGTVPGDLELALAPDGSVTTSAVPTLHETTFFSKDGAARTLTTGTSATYSSFAFSLR